MPEARDEAGLLARIAGGDRVAFGAFLERHLDAVVRFAGRYTGSRADAEDVAQETFLRVWTRAGTWRDRGFSPRSWLYRIAYTRCVDLLRRRRPDLPLPEEDPDGRGEAAAGLYPLGAHADPAVQAAHDARLTHLVEAVARLPERQYTALNLCAWEGLSNREAGAVMGLSVEALESLLARARRRLKTALTEQYTE